MVSLLDHQLRGDATRWEEKFAVRAGMTWWGRRNRWVVALKKLLGRSSRGQTRASELSSR